MSQREDFLQKCLVLDTETTSDDYKVAEVVEVGFVINDNGWQQYQELYKPDIPIPPLVESICYITNKMVKDKKRFIDEKSEFQELANGFQYLIAHNHFYDMRVLHNHGIKTDKNEWICTWRMIKKLFNGDDTVTATNLPYLRFRFDLDFPITQHCHRAGNDAYLTALLLEMMIDKMEAEGIIDINVPYGPQIIAWLNEPIIYKLMPIGKYKNTKMEDVPIDYWKWALKNMDSLNENADNYDADFAASVNAVIEQKLNKI
jgi:exodeoxyribonuclease X